MKHDPLFQLVKSLTDAELLAFNNENEHANETIYVQLFREIISSEVYNEESLKASLNITTSNFSVTKSYLIEAINKTLRNFHNGNDPEFHFPKEIHTIRVYLRKELHDLAEKRLQSLKRYCIKYLLIEQLPEVLSLEYRIAGFKRKDTSKVEAERQKLSDELKDFFVLVQLNHKLFNLYAQSQKISPQKLKKQLLPFEKSFNSFKIASIKKNPRVHDVYLGCGVWLNFMKGNMMQAFLFQKEKASVSFNNRYMQDFNARGLLAIANNVASLAFEIENEKEHNIAVKQMNDWQSKLKGYQLLKNEYNLYHKLLSLQWHYSLNISENELNQLAADFQSNFKSFVVIRQLVNMVSFTVSYIKLNNPEKALEFINQFLHHPAYKSHTHLYIHIRVLQILALVMLNNFASAKSNAESLVKFATKEIDRKNPAYIFAKKMRSLSSVNPQKTFNSCLAELETCPPAEYSKFALHCIDLKAFLKRSL